MAITPDGNTLVSVCGGFGVVRFWDVARKAERARGLDHTGRAILSLALSPDGKALFVVQRKLNQIAVVDIETGKISKTKTIGQRPDMVATDPNGETLFVVVRGENKLLRLSAADLEVTAEVATGTEPHGVAYRP